MVEAIDQLEYIVLGRRPLAHAIPGPSRDALRCQGPSRLHYRGRYEHTNSPGCNPKLTLSQEQEPAVYDTRLMD